ncbi:MAG: hypothetical protein JOZ77_11945 [Candidatus Eremiobacteraeota bacterium]|nr:hypothetical protein [Candidatus Eremiobacteraeota bacterium]
MRCKAIAATGVMLVFAAGCTANRTLPAATSSEATREFHGTPAGAPRIALDARSSGPSVSSDVYGASLDTWYDFRRGFVNPSLHETGIHLVRFPGGSESDAYHWEKGGSLCDKQGYITPPATFDHLMRGVAEPLKIDIAITLNYGSNRACDGGGEPSEAAAWAAYAKNKGYHVSYWTVGNEVYGSWEYDLHAHAHDPHTYSRAFRTGYYPQMKKADSQAQVGIVVDLPSDTAWNDVVLREAKPFDFVEVHYYPEYNNDNDKFLLGTAVDAFAQDLSGLRAQMNAAHLSKSMPIYLGEYNNDAGNEGKQSVSIVNGLYVGQMIGTLQNAGVPRATFWLAYGSCDENGDFSKKLYGWQNFGSEAMFSDDLPNSYGCADTPVIRGGTPFPTARVMALMAKEIPDGSQVRQVNVPGSLGDNLRAYGFAHNGGYALAIFNNTLSALNVEAGVQHSAETGFAGTLTTYGKVQYDESKRNKWVGPVQKDLGRVGTTVPLTLPPYSLSTLVLK